MSDDEDDADFFTAKRRPHVARVPSPPRQKTPEARSDDSEDDGGKKKRKKTTSKRSKPSLPGWTRRDKRSVGRGSTEERRSASASASASRHDPIVIGDSDDEAPRASSPRKQTRKRTVEITPPPELSAAKKAELQEATRLWYEGLREVAEEESGSALAAIPEAEQEREPIVEPIRINVKMAADPARLSGSDRAYREWTKQRVFTVCRRQPLRNLVHALADRIAKRPEDIVLVHNGSKILSFLLSPAALNIGDDGDLVGYEKSLWDKMEAERRKRIADELVDVNLVSSSPEPQDNGAPSHSEPASPPPEPQRKKTRIVLSGEEKQIPVSIEANVTAQQLCKWYCSKMGWDTSIAGTLKLSFDGDDIAPTARLLDELDVEDGDLVEVHKR